MTLVVVSRRARVDVLEILSFLHREAGANTADRYGAEISAFYGRIGEHPRSGAPRPRLGRDVRIGVIAPYVVIYAFDREADEVRVLRVVDGRRRIARSLLSPS